MRSAWILVLSCFLGGCGEFFDELPLADEATRDSTTGNEANLSGTETVTQGMLDCARARSDCPSQDLMRACLDGEAVARAESCQLRCGELTPVTCWAQRDGSDHGCWCEETGARNLSGCAGLLDCVSRCGGPDQNPLCTHRCFARTDALTARVYGALIYCAQNECAPLCQTEPAACAACIQQTSAGRVGSCASLRSVCIQDRGLDQGILPGS